MAKSFEPNTPFFKACHKQAQKWQAQALFMKAKTRIITGYEYNLDQLIGTATILATSDKTIKQLIKLLDNHYQRTNSYPHKWTI